MNCKEILDYIELIEKNEPRACKEQHALVKFVRKVFDTEDLTVNSDQLEKYTGMARYFSFGELFPWEKFLMALWDCTYTKDGEPRFDTLFFMGGRGSGKDAFIAIDALALTSPYNPIDHYDVDICANNGEQATRPVIDIVEALEGKYEKKLKKYYSHTKEIVKGRQNLGVIKGRTNNPKGRDGMRSGKIVLNEVHAYQNYDNIKVFTTGLGKVDCPRTGIFTSNGDVNDGPLDDYIARANRILFEDEADRGFLPFICRLEDKKQVDDKKNWYMANPSLAYRPSLFRETEKEYYDWKENPEQNSDFLTKRMGIRQGFKELSVTDYENVLLTKKQLPELQGWTCTGGIDYAELSDWAGVNLHFRDGDYRYDINHAWVCLNSKTLSRVRAPWKTWAEQGHITVVDDVSINPNLLAEYLYRMGEKYNIKKLAMDGFRWTLVSDAMKRIGFDALDKTRVKLVRPSDIMKIEPVIQECFGRHFFYWGDNPCLRWAVNNTKRVRSSRNVGVDTGNFIYAKIEGKSRKTDPWMALVASMTIEDVLASGTATGLPPIGAITF